MRRRLARLPRGGRLLDIGCATGIFVAQAMTDWRAVGTDVSLAACRVARQRGLDVVVSDAARLPLASGSHDVVTLWDTLEHLPDPLAVLGEVARILRPGGSLVLSTGDVSSWCARLSGSRWHLFTLPEHRYFFSRDSLEPLLNRVGLRCTACYHDGARYSAAYLVERLVKSLLGTTRGLERLSQLRLVRDATLYINLFDVMTLEAERASPTSGGTPS